MQASEQITPDQPSSEDEEPAPPRNLTRYRNSVAAFIPLRAPIKDTRTDLPIDDIGCVTNTSFQWVRKYLISAKSWNTYKNSLSPFLESLVTDHKLLIPNPPESDSCEVNGRRFLRIFKEQETRRDPKEFPRFMSLVAWKFCSTRVLVSTLIYALSIFIGLLGTVLFVQLTLRSMQREFDLVETMYLRAVQNSISKPDTAAESPHHSPLKLTEFLWGKTGKNLSSSTGSFLPVDLFQHATEYNSDLESSNDSALFSLFNTQLMTASLFVFLNQTNNKEDAVTEFLRFEEDVNIEQLNRIGYSVGLILCVVIAFYLRSATNWMNLRTATRLRSGILASVYRRAMKSSVNYTVTANQILTVANEESNVIFNFVENGALIIGTLCGLVFSLAAAFVLLNVTGIWPTVVMVVELLLLVLLAFIASYYFRQGMVKSGQKLSVVEEVCVNFKSIVVMGLEKIYLDRFFEASYNHHNMIRKAVVWSSASFIGGITSAVLLTGLYVNWCFVETDGISVLILIIVFAFFMKNLTLEFGSSVQSITLGTSAVNNLLTHYLMVKPKTFKSMPPEPYVVKFTEEAAFKWPDEKSVFLLNLDHFSIIKGQVVGLTGPSGSGKTTFLYSLLGHTELIQGTVRIKYKMAFFPKIPVIIAGSLKDNILMGADYDPRRYYDAICAVKLNQDVFVTTDTDEMPIGGLELDRGQLERVVLARAAYSDSEMFLFDDPLASVKDTKEAVVYMKNVLDMMAMQKKTVLMATQNGQLLTKCRIIHLLDNGKVLKSATYTEFVECRTFPSLYEDYEVLRNCAGFDEAMNGCHPNGINTIKPQKIKLSRRSIRLDTAAYNINADEIMMEQENKIKTTLKNLPVISYTFLFFVYLISNLMYYLLPFGFIVIVKRRYIDTWMTYIGVSVVVSIFLLDLLTRYHLAFMSQRLSKRYEKYLFFRLFRTSVNYLKTKVISDVVNWFNMDMFATFQPYAAIIQSSVAATLAVGLLIISNPWTIALVPLLAVGFVLTYLRLQYTVSHLYEKEYRARQNLFMVVTNHLTSRSVIQSFNRVQEFSDIAYKVIEENTTSIFLRKSMKYHGQFLLNVVLTFGLAGLCLIMLLIPYSKLSVHRYALALFAYFSLGYYLQRLLFDGLLEIIVSKIKLENTKNNKKQIEMVKSPTAVETIADISKGVPVTFKEVVCKIAMKTVLEIRKVHVRSSEVVGVRGKGATCVVPMVYRILNPESGATFLAEHDLQQFDDTQLKTLVGTVLSDPYIPKVSVQNYLDPRSQWKTADIIEALRSATIFEKVKPFIFEPMEELTQSDKQLLCLAKCLMAHPKILIIENVHPHTQYIINICVKKYFKDAAVVIIGGSEKQFTTCDRMSELV